MFILEMRRRVEQLMSSDRPLYMFRSTVRMCGTEAGSPGSIFVRLVLFASLIGHLPNTQVDNNLVYCSPSQTCWPRQGLSPHNDTAPILSRPSEWCEDWPRQCLMHCQHCGSTRFDDGTLGGTVQVSRLGVDKLKRTSTVLVSPHSCELVVIRALLASRRRSCMGRKQPPIKKRIKIKKPRHPGFPRGPPPWY